MSTQNEQRFRPSSLLSLLVLALGGLWLTACSATTQGPSHLMTQGVAAPPAGAFQFCLENRAECGLPADDLSAAKDMSKSAPSQAVSSAPSEAPSDAPALTEDQLLGLARVVNAAINTAISYRTDATVWDMEERWVLPLSREGLSYGDCEDFALEKRAALLAAGAPADRLRMATAWSPGTGLHAVLILRLEAGDYVLDSATPHLLTVAETRYEWRSLQTGATLLEWSVVSNTLNSGPDGVYTAG